MDANGRLPPASRPRLLVVFTVARLIARRPGGCPCARRLAARVDGGAEPSSWRRRSSGSSRRCGTRPVEALSPGVGPGPLRQVYSIARASANPCLSADGRRRTLLVEQRRGPGVDIPLPLLRPGRRRTHPALRLAARRHGARRLVGFAWLAPGAASCSSISSREVLHAAAESEVFSPSTCARRAAGCGFSIGPGGRAGRHAFTWPWRHFRSRRRIRVTTLAP